VLGLWPGNQHIARDVKGQAVKFGFTDDVLDGFASASPLDEYSQFWSIPGLIVPMRGKPSTISIWISSSEDMQKKSLGIEPCSLWMRTLDKQILCLGYQCTDLVTLMLHELTSAFNCSAW
jgi:hypothetical protein